MSKKSKRAARLAKRKAEEDEKMLKVILGGKGVKNPNALKVYLVSPPRSYNKDYAFWFQKDPEFTLTNNPSECDFMVFTGGQDICPKIYGQPQHKRTHYNIERDRYEMSMFALGMDKFKVGICRGAQFLNAMSGGSMIQNVGDSAHSLGLRAHAIQLQDGRVIHGAPSTHHQMMIPSRNMSQRSIIATAYDEDTRRRTLCSSFNQKEVPEVMFKHQENFLKSFTTLDFDPTTMDPEVILYHNTHSLCIQGHPEKQNASGPFQGFCADLISNLVKRHVKKRGLITPINLTTTSNK
jgi:hypothetical protein